MGKKHFAAITLVCMALLIGAVAANQGLVLYFAPYPYLQPLPNPGHGADTVWIDIPASGEMTLQDAINIGVLGGGGSGEIAYVSDWKSIVPQGNVTFDHDLGTDALIVTIQMRRPGGAIHQQHHSDYGGWGLGVEAYEITSTQIKVSAGNYLRFFKSTGAMDNIIPSVEIRVLAIK